MPRPLRERLASIDWRACAESLEERGYARLPGLLTAAECRATAALYERPEHFRKRIDLAKQRFGAGGDYQYFRYPLPPLVAGLRTALYPRLAEIAGAWQRALGGGDGYPGSLRAYLAHCHAQGQTKPTPLLLRYRAGGYNLLHRDLYGPVAFPLQLTCLLSRPGEDFRGGEFLLLEQRPRMQSRGEAVALRRGEGILFPTAERPVRGARGLQRAQMRHGVSRLHAGNRLTLGVIFHDAA